jgi:endonuclease III
MRGIMGTKPGRRINREALNTLASILRMMNRESSARGAAVIRAERATEGDPFRILVFTMLSARTKDDTTLGALERLFAKAKTPRDVASLPLPALEKALYGVGFFRVKARHLKALSRMVAENKGKVPDTLEGMLMLPGVGRKTANIVLARVHGHNRVGVDVHVHRISNRLGIVRTEKPHETEAALVRSVPARLLPRLNREFVAFGQTVCLPRNPECGICPLGMVCYRAGVSEQCERCAYGK